jgi:hypothetical protein
MSIRGNTAVVGIGETPTDRLGGKPGEAKKSTAEYLAWAARLAMDDAGLSKKDFDGQGLAAIYTTNHSQPFWPEEVAAILGITPRAPFRCSAMRRQRSPLGCAISFWSSPQPRRLANMAATAARPPTRAILKCPLASWDRIAKFPSS